MKWTREKLEQTEWAQWIKRVMPMSYERVLAIALRAPVKVMLQHTKEFSAHKHPGVWIATPIGLESLWIGVGESKKEIEQLCSKMGWKIETTQKGKR